MLWAPLLAVGVKRSIEIAQALARVTVSSFHFSLSLVFCLDVA
jgi:hypothetical protein